MNRHPVQLKGQKNKPGAGLTNPCYTGNCAASCLLFLRSFICLYSVSMSFSFYLALHYFHHIPSLDLPFLLPCTFFIQAVIKEASKDVAQIPGLRLNMVNTVNTPLTSSAFTPFLLHQAHIPSMVVLSHKYDFLG